VRRVFSSSGNCWRLGISAPSELGNGFGAQAGASGSRRVLSRSCEALSLHAVPGRPSGRPHRHVAVVALNDFSSWCLGRVQLPGFSSGLRAHVLARSPPSIQDGISARLHSTDADSEPAASTIVCALRDKRHLSVTLGFGIVLVSAERRSHQSMVPPGRTIWHLRLP